MENKKKRSVHSIMRALHRDIGFLILGLLVIHVISGIDLVYRDQGTHILKRDKQMAVEMMPNIQPEDLKKNFFFRRMKDFKITKVENDKIYFTGGSYNQKTGDAIITRHEGIFPFNKFIKIHKAISRQPSHWINILFGIAVFFLAVSSFWMYKPGTKFFARGLYFTLAGMAMTIIMMACV